MGKKNNYVDGYTALRAAQRAAQEKRVSAAGPPPAASPAMGTAGQRADSSAPIAAHAHRTVMPTKYEVVCYECGFSFTQAGRAKHTACPKCRTILEFMDRVIDGEWNDVVKTAGRVTVKPGAIVKGGELFAADIILHGRIEAGKAVAYRWLEVHEDAFFDQTCVRARDLRLCRKAPLNLQAPSSFRDVELEDVLTGEVDVSGLLHIKPGGSMDGSVKARHLRVDEGGGLRARVRIGESGDG